MLGACYVRPVPVPAGRAPSGEDTMARRATARRTAALGIMAALGVLGLLLGGCGQARGGGTLGEPLPGGALMADYQGRARFGFTFRCEARGGRVVVRGQLEYRDPAPSTITLDGVTRSFAGVVLHGTVDASAEGESSCAGAGGVGLPVAQFGGTYRPQGPGAREPGRFRILVFGQGEPGRTRGEITGDAFAIELTGGAFDGYTRAGYIEAGNVQVDGSDALEVR